MARVRVHQHVNPLAKYYRELPIEPLQTEKVFRDSKLPLFLDIGCGRGRFLLEMAGQDDTQNFLGVEIREPLVIEANEIVKNREIENLHYEFCNATIDLDVYLKNLRDESLKFVTIQFPDPWFKKRHAKRRMVQDKLVETVVEKLAKDATIFIQTDVEFLADEMFELFTQKKTLAKTALKKNPLPVKTEREKSVENRDLPVYRAMFKKLKS